jgi:phytoene dehydrogenase-like protein
VRTVDAVVVGSGPNGLVAACLLADAGWDVCVLEAAERFGGAVASDQVVPGFTSDTFSAFYPLAAASPVFDALDLGAHGLHWRHAPAVLAHPHAPDSDRAAVMHRDAERTAAALDADAAGDGESWLRLVRQWNQWRDPLLRAILGPFPPARAALALLRRAGSADALRLARLLLLPVDRMGAELFAGTDGRLLLAGNAMHADIPAVAAGSGAFGWLLAMLGQDVGFPVPAGGAGRLADALVSRARWSGAQLQTGSEVTRIVVGNGRALGVLTAGGEAVRARRAVLADVSATSLYGRLLAPDDVPHRLRDDLRRFEWDLATVKVNWALDGPMPWRAQATAAAGTVHLGAAGADLTVWSAELAAGRMPRDTFVLLGQMAVADPSRAPAGAESVWAYSHLPRAANTRQAAVHLAERIQQTVRSYAPGLDDLVRHCWVQLPGDLAGADANLTGGAVNGGTAQLHQQLMFRPVPGFGRTETVVPGLYLASAAGHPGGGVHGAVGAQAARAAIAGARLDGLPARLISTGLRRLYQPPALSWPVSSALRAPGPADDEAATG